MDGNSALLALGAIALVWVAMRSLGGGKRSRSGLGAMFRKEKAPDYPGIGPKAIRGMLDEVIRFVEAQPDIHGAVLIGAYAAGKARAKDTVEIIILLKSGADFSSPDALAAWGYPLRGHAVLSHEVKTIDGVFRHALRLQGAPPICFYGLKDADSVLKNNGARLTAALDHGVLIGAQVLTGDLATTTALQRWRDRTKTA